MLDRADYYINFISKPLSTVTHEHDDSVRQPFKTSDTQVIDKKIEQGRGDLEVISSEHGRSTVETVKHLKVVWADEFGNLYGTSVWKGNLFPDFSKLGVVAGYIVGMQTYEDAENQVKISRILRQHQIPTEAIKSIRKIKKVFLNGVEVPIEVAIQDVVRRKKEELIVLEQRLQQLTDPESDEADDLKYEIKNIKKGIPLLEKSEFVVIERDMEVAERLRDLSHLQTEKELCEFLDPVFKWVNQKERIKQKDNDPEYSFDTQKIESIKEYFIEYLPMQMATNLARLHGMGLYNTNLNSGNWLLSGVFVDFDYRKDITEAWDDEKRRVDNGFFADNYQAIAAIINTMRWLDGILKTDLVHNENVYINYLVTYISTLRKLGHSDISIQEALVEIGKVIPKAFFGEYFDSIWRSTEEKLMEMETQK